MSENVENVVPMLTAAELADAIDWTHGAIRSTATTEPCLKDLEAHLRALLAVQRARAEVLCA